LADRLELCRDGGTTAQLFARAAGTVQMAGYNSTVEALAAGVRPVLVPRRNPRREQAIRAARLACLGLADIVDESASAAEVSWLLDQPRHVDADAYRRAGISFDGAAVAAERLLVRTMADAA
jgi:predicted glycosyltransferase